MRAKAEMAGADDECEVLPVVPVGKKVSLMYINKNIVLREDLPEKLKIEFQILQEYYDADDWLMFDIYLEAFEATVKAHYIAGKISMEDLRQIFER